MRKFVKIVIFAGNYQGGIGRAQVIGSNNI